MNETQAPNNGGWLGRLKQGLGKSSSKLGDGLKGLFTKRKLDGAALEDLEDLLITADMGARTAAKITAEIARTRFDKDIDPDEIRAALAVEIEKILNPVAVPFTVDAANRPHVVLVCGVNGSGKTTSIGKLAKQLGDQGLKVVLAAGDTFRAAAVEQLQVWGERAGAEVITAAAGADAAGLAYEALQKARTGNADVLLIDTAGRLQNKKHLMAELEKIIRVIRKLDADAPHDCLLVLDAGVGQNAHSQVQAFTDVVQVSGLLMTKLDGTARGGVVVSLAEKFALPVHAIGVGEGIGDMRPFDARDFARALVGI